MTLMINTADIKDIGPFNVYHGLYCLSTVIRANSMHYYVKDYQGNVRQVTDADGNVEQDNHYYPYGMLMAESSDILATARGGSVINPNPYLYGAKEYLTTAGANLLDFTARTYDPSLPLFQTQDLKADVFASLNCYAYCASDPVNHIDPDGRIVYLLGTEAEEARSQLQNKVGESITLKLDDKGMLTYQVNNPNKKLKGDAKRMVKEIDDNNITVHLKTTDTQTTSSGEGFIGGAFMGNDVAESEDGKTVTVDAYQEVNPYVLKKMDDAHSKNGANMFHEVTEAYEGAVISKNRKKSSPKAGVKGSVYEKAHRKASPQSGDAFRRFLDKNGNELSPTDDTSAPPGTTHIQWYVKDKKGNIVVLKQFP